MFGKGLLAVFTLHAALISANSARIKIWQVGETVQTTSGSVTGHPASIAPEVSEYLGIPYGKPTTGDLRFAAPVAYIGNGSILGTNYSADCPINPAALPPVPTDSILYKYFLSQDQSSHTFSEDCLSVNVWTKPQVGETKKAVMVYIYGGGFTIGTSNAIAYDGAILAEDQDVVVVTFNYRVNFFGFASPPGLPHYNFGLLDQRLAVEWVAKNIASFHGDPSRITLFGQSAGGASVDIYSYAWTENPLVHAFIPESGAVGVLTGGAADSAGDWYNISQILGCGGAEAGNSSLSCIRGKSVGEILSAVATSGRSFVPVVDNVTIFGDYDARGKAGKFVKAPVLIGNNDNEAGLFQAASGGNLPAAATTEINLGFTCPVANAAAYRSMNDIKAYRYRYFGVWPNLAISPDAGTFHSAEVPMIFGNAKLVTGINDTPAEIAVAKLMRNAWGSFAKDLEHAFDKLRWPVYDPKGNALIQLARNDSTTPSFVNSTMFDDGCGGVLVNPFR